MEVNITSKRIFDKNRSLVICPAAEEALVRIEKTLNKYMKSEGLSLASKQGATLNDIRLDAIKAKDILFGSIEEKKFRRQKG
jgi:NRPS condensation-like uncharacterized protein